MRFLTFKNHQNSTILVNEKMTRISEKCDERAKLSVIFTDSSIK